MVTNIVRVVKQNSRVGLLAVSIFLLAGTVSAEPEFGGEVEEIILCTCGDNAGGKWIDVGDPHGGEYLEKPGSTDVKDCGSPEVGEWVLGMSTENTEDCQQRIYNVCVTVASGEVIDHYGQSQTGGCDSGLEGDASGDGKTEMMTPDGRTADGGDEDDGGPSGGPSNATQSDTHLATVDGVKADGLNASDMITSDNQNDEGGNTTKMVTAPTGRKEDGTNSNVFTSSGAGDGYSPGGAGIGGEGYGSVGGSVGSGGLQSPVVLGNKDQKKEMPKKTKATEKLDIAASYDTQEVTNKEIMLKLLIVIGGIGGAGYFVFRSIKKLLS